MDGALSSSRYGGGGSDDRRYNNNNNNRGGGRFRGGGGGRGGRHSNYNNQSRQGQQQHHRHHPYNRGGGGPHRHRGGGGGGRRNALAPEQRDGGLLQLLSAMLSRVGDVVIEEHATEGSVPPRPEVILVAKNISDVTAVASLPASMKMFFEYNSNPSGPSVRTDVDMNNYYQNTNNSAASAASASVTTVQAQNDAGLLVHLLVSCASTLVLQTPGYVALTLALHEASKNQSQGEFAGFAARCVTYAMQCFSRDIDMLLLESLLQRQQQQQHQQPLSGDSKVVITQVQRAKTACRLKLLLRYFALLARLNIIQSWQDHDISTDSDSEVNIDKLTVLGLFKVLVAMATRLVRSPEKSVHASRTNTAAAYVLALLVLSNVPYLIACDIPMHVITQSLLHPLESIMSIYQQASPYTPGLGSTAILLKDEPYDEEDGGDGDDEEEEEDDDDEGDAQQQPVCDSLQDMWRSVQNLAKQVSQASADEAGSAASTVASSTKFALLSDDPWNYVRISTGDQNKASTGDQNKASSGKVPGQSRISTGEGPIPILLEPIAFVELPHLLELAPDCRAVQCVLNDRGQSSTQLCQHLTVDGIIFGRLPVFGSPPSPGGEDDDDVEGASPASAPQTESLRVYQQTFGWNDRCFVAEAVRDCILSYESTISTSGIERGTAKDVAERIWLIHQSWKQASDIMGNKKGLEYAILETLLSLIIQSPVLDQGAVRHVYVSRVLLELTRQQPSSVPQALALAVSNLFQDYMPSLAPYARDNLCRWLAFHLANTEYQWPTAYWRHWTTFVVADSHHATPRSNSRSLFVQRTLTVMSSNVHELQHLSQDCLPADCALNRYLLPHANASITLLDGSIASLEQDLQERIWQRNEDPDSLVDFLLGDEVAESYAAALDHDNGDDWRKTWWRTSVIVRALLSPAAQEHVRLNGFIEKVLHEQMANEAMTLDGVDATTSISGDDDTDVVAQLLEILPRYRSVVLAALSRDGECLADQQHLGGSDKMSDRHILDYGEACLLQTVHSVTYYSRTVLETVVESLIQHKLVSATAVLRWVLADFGKDCESLPIDIVERWWEIASLAIRVSWANKLADNGSSEMVADGIGMIVDATGDDAATAVDKSPAKLLLNELVPLLPYTVQRIHTLLTKQGGNKKKLTAFQIDLIEGIKYFVLSSHSLFYSLHPSQGDTEGSVNEILEFRLEQLLAQSNVCGANLASISSQLGSGDVAINLLRSVLERI